MTRCNNCNTLSKEEAQKCCVFEDCPHKEAVAETPIEEVSAENVEASSIEEAKTPNVFDKIKKIVKRK